MSINREQLYVKFDTRTGLPSNYTYDPDGICIDSYLGGSLPISVVCKNVDNGELQISTALYLGSSQTESGTRQHYSFQHDGENAGEFSVDYRTECNSLFISCGDVKESNGFHLMEIRIDSFVVSTKDEHPKFISNRRGGYLSDLDHLNGDCSIVDDGEWKGYPNMSIFPCLAIIKANSVCTVEIQGYVCNARMDLSQEAVSIGVRAPYRISGSNGLTPDLPVNQKEICRIDFGADVDNNGEINWLDAAKLVRSKLPKLPDTYFDDKIVYIIQNQLGRKETDLTFSETEKLVERISNLIDGNPHVAMLTGWSQGGHDTSYPNIFTLNPKLGTEEEFFTLKKDAKEKYNCNISLNDNYDDQYINEFTKDGHFNADNIGKRADNSSETFLAWNGTDVSYISGMAKYMEDGGHGEKRVDYEGEHYKVEKAILIDALSWWSIRHNWNPEFPASAVDNLRAKFKIIDRFKQKFDVNVLSELVRYPFIGKLCIAFDNNVCFWTPCDNDIPFLRVALKDSMYYGQKAGESLDLTDFLYHNSAKHPWFRKDESSERISDIYYLNYVPWFLIKSLDMLSYSCSGGIYRMDLENDCHIDLDYPQRRWKVTYQGNTILENDNLSCPMSGDRLAFYSKEGKTLSYTLPAEKAVAGVRKLSDRGSEVYDHFSTAGQTITVACPPNTPIIIDIKI